MKIVRWLVIREFWENRAIWIIPASIGAMLVLAALFGRVEFDIGAVAPRGHLAGGLLLFAFDIVFLLAMSAYTAWYMLDCLHADRKDRSILFWKSLPISDAATVLSKLAMGLLVIPLVYFAVSDMTTLLIAFIVSVRARSWIGNSLWQPDTWFQLQALWLYLIVTIAIWFLPVTGWLMFVSAWAKRAVALWSLLLPLALIWAERAFFGSHMLAGWLSSRIFTGYLATAFRDGADPAMLAIGAVWGDRAATPISAWNLMNPLGFIASPAVWIGALVGAALLAGTIRLRSRCVEIQ